ncbi:MAG: cytochrome C [Deltaproteobacteria bacterium]|nr:cytochrome C [Deltaproteobacteria bacterium]
MTRRWLLSAGAALAIWSASADGRLPSRVIIPEQSIPLKFDHAVHTGKLKMKCTTCHDGILSSVRAADRNIPGHRVCTKCHDVTTPDAERAPGVETCEFCHVGKGPYSKRALPPPAVFPTANLKFPHRLHLERNIGCETCHKGITKTKLASRAHLPEMATCLTCHTGKKAPSRCATCHIATPDDRVVTRYAEGDLRPAGIFRNDRHDPDWIRSHRNVAKPDQSYCMNCHAQSYCLECHAGIRKPMQVHQNDFLLLHAMAARKNQPDCQSCHRDQSFCAGCHMRTGVARESARWQAVSTTATFHPSGWVNSRGSPNHHSYQAQRNIRSCTSCHVESTCMKCHATAAKGATQFFKNPHPPGFKSFCFVRAKNKRSCAKCHVGADLDALCRS